LNKSNKIHTFIPHSLAHTRDCCNHLHYLWIIFSHLTEKRLWSLCCRR